MSDTDRPAAERFNAPWPSIVLPALLVTAYLAQEALLTDAGLRRHALSVPMLVQAGHADVLVTHIFLHAGWTHVIMNAASALAFGPPVARLFGERGGAAALFFLFFFLICGVLAGLGYVALHLDSVGVMIGASGAVSGLWGAASRLLGRRGTLAPILSRQVINQAAVFTVLNVAIGLAGGFASLNIAWEAHLAGYLAGLLLIRPISLLAHRSRGRELPSG